MFINLCLCQGMSERRVWSQLPWQTLNTGLRHPCSNHCHSWLCHRSPKNGQLTVFLKSCQLMYSFLLMLKWQFVTDNSDYITFSLITAHIAHVAQIKPMLFETKLRGNSFFSFFLLFFLPGADFPHIYMRAWMLCCFHGLINTQTCWKMLTVLVDSYAEIKSAPSVA